MPQDPKYIYPPSWEPKDKLGTPEARLEGTIARMSEREDDYNPGQYKVILTIDLQGRPHTEPAEFATEAEAAEYRTIFIGWKALLGRMAKWDWASPIELGERVVIELTGTKDTGKGNPMFTWEFDMPERPAERRPKAPRPQFSRWNLDADEDSEPEARADTAQPSAPAIITPPQTEDVGF